MLVPSTCAKGDQQQEERTRIVGEVAMLILNDVRMKQLYILKLQGRDFAEPSESSVNYLFCLPL